MAKKYPNRLPLPLLIKQIIPTNANDSDIICFFFIAFREPYECKVDDKIAVSDHYPIICKLKMRPKKQK